MSNKTQLQINNAQYASLIEMLRGKAAGGGSNNTAQVSLKATNASIWYVGINGLTELGNSTETAEMIVPSICIAQSASTLSTSITGNCEPITTFNDIRSRQAFYITGDAFLEVIASGGGGAD